jgi:hypothetical protein
MKADLSYKPVAGALILSALYLLYDYIFSSAGINDGYAWGILSNYLVSLLLSYYVVYSQRHGWKLVLMVFAIYFLIGHFNLLVEALIFGVTDRSQTLLEMLRGLVISLLYAPLLVILFDSRKEKDALQFVARPYWNWSWRIMLANFIYLVFYLTAGIVLTIVYPDVLNFYEGKIPPMDVMIETQLLLRGFIFVFVAILVLRTLNVPMLNKAVVVGLIFAILGGVAQLIPPNDFMPSYVRLGHGFEVGISNFLYGVTISYLLRQHQSGSHTVDQPED